jgi:hypothetical protein
MKHFALLLRMCCSFEQEANLVKGGQQLSLNPNAFAVTHWTQCIRNNLLDPMFLQQLAEPAASMQCISSLIL